MINFQEIINNEAKAKSRGIFNGINIGMTSWIRKKEKTVNYIILCEHSNTSIRVSGTNKIGWMGSTNGESCISYFLKKKWFL